ncbi:hypothetical protein P7C70_g3037, partial [Phenoliferia sp. Uapishka_3]
MRPRSPTPLQQLPILRHDTLSTRDSANAHITLATNSHSAAEAPGRPSHLSHDLPDLSQNLHTKLETGSYFWSTFLALCGASFLTALDTTAVSTLLPTLAGDLGGENAVWLGSAYALANATIMPWAGGFAGILGRKVILLSSLTIFAVGSAITGAAGSMTTAILGRAVQGVGSGGITTLPACSAFPCKTYIIVVDMIPLAERGFYTGVLISMWAVASVAGPPIGGAFATTNLWRWLFYMNIPICLVAGTAIIFGMKVKTPNTSWREKAAEMDYYVKGASPLLSGVEVFPLALTIAPSAILAGWWVSRSGTYKLQNMIGWSLSILGFGLMTILKSDSSTALWAVFISITGLGIGSTLVASSFPVNAPIHPDDQPAVSAFQSFCRAFAGVVAITIGGSILQNRLVEKLPYEVFEQFRKAEETSGIAYKVIPFIHIIPEPLKTQVRDAYTDSLRTVWQALVALNGIGLVLSLFMDDIKMSSKVSAKWGLKDMELKGEGELEAVEEEAEYVGKP